MHGIKHLKIVSNRRLTQDRSIKIYSYVEPFLDCLQLYKKVCTTGNVILLKTEILICGL